MWTLAGPEPDERRAGYAARVAKCLAASAVQAQAWPQGPETYRVVYVGHATQLHGVPGIIIEFEPDVPLDPDGSWTARILLPRCCRKKNQSEALEESLDKLAPDGTVAVRGAGIAAAAARATQAWTDHASHIRQPHDRPRHGLAAVS